MSKVFIELPDRIQYAIEKGITRNGTGASQILIDAVKCGKVICDSATNGDVFRTMFPKAEFVTVNKTNGNKYVVVKLDDYHVQQFDYDWWTSPYV